MLVPGGDIGGGSDIGIVIVGEEGRGGGRRDELIRRKDTVAR